MSFAAPNRSRRTVAPSSPSRQNGSPIKSPYARSKQSQMTYQEGALEGDSTNPEYNERVRQLEAENAELADHIFLSGLENTDKMPSEVAGGFASSEDPNKKFWLRNEVIGFERQIAALTEQRDDALTQADTANAVARDAVAEKGAMQEEIQSREETLRDLVDDKVRLSAQVADYLTQLKAARAEIEAVRLQKGETQKRLERSEGELIATREQAGVLTSIQAGLEARCKTLQNDLQELRDNPRIPLEFKQAVEQNAAEQDAHIARLEEDIARLTIENATLQAANSNTTDELEAKIAEIEMQTDLAASAEQRALSAQEQVAVEQIKREELGEENKMLQDELAKKPKEVTRTVYVETEAPKPEEPEVLDEGVTDEFLLELFDDMDVDETGFAPLKDLADELQVLEGEQPKLKELVGKMRAINAIVLERDDFKILLARWRGVIEEAPEGEEGPLSDSALVKLFEALDEEQYGFVEKAVLVEKLKQKSASDSSLGALVELVGGQKPSIVNREDYIDLLQQRHGAGEEVEEEVVVVKEEVVVEGGKGELDREQLMELFDSVDSEKCGYAARLKLRDAVKQHENSAKMTDILNNHEEMIIGREAFEQMMLE